MKFKLANFFKPRVSEVQVSHLSKNQELTKFKLAIFFTTSKVSRVTVRQKVSNSRVKLEVRLTFFYLCCHRPCAMPSSTPMMHDDNQGDEGVSAEATTSSLRASTISTFVTNEDAPLTLLIHRC